MPPIRLLLVDRNLSYLDIAKKMLKFHDESYDIDVATTGEACLEKLVRNNIELIMLDYDIDDGKGLRVLDSIIQDGHNIPIIMLLDEGQEEIAFQALEQGASDYIMKVRGYLTALPFTVGKVLESHKYSGKQVTRTTVYRSQQQSIHASNADEIYFILNRRGHFISANKKLEPILDYSEAEILELSLQDLIPREYESRYDQWFANLTSEQGTTEQLQTQLTGKYGEKRDFEISLKPVRNEDGEITSFKGKLIPIKKATSNIDSEKDPGFNQGRMIRELVSIISAAPEESLSHLLDRLTKTICHIFQFKRATLALLDPRRDVFIKHALVGFNGQHSSSTIHEVPRDIIDKAFQDQYKIRIMYFDQNLETDLNGFLGDTDRRKQPRRVDRRWHPKDLIIINLLNPKKQSFGYISLDSPEFDLVPSREFFYNLELCSDLVSLAIQNYYRFTNLEKRNRRLTKQLLSANIIFKLDQNLGDILHEFVWSIKFSLEFNLVMLGLISVNSGKLEIKAVACDDKIKTIQVKELKFAISNFRMLTQKQYKRGKFSYFVTQQEPILDPLKEIYYRSERPNASDTNYWPWWSVLLVPIRSTQEENKLMGFLIVDDPADFLIPSADSVHTLEILASQIAVAIENKKLHLQQREDISLSQASPEFGTEPQRGIRKLMDRLLNNLQN